MDNVLIAQHISGNISLVFDEIVDHFFAQLPDIQKPAGGSVLLQKNESVRYNYVVDRELMHHFGETFDDWTLLHYDDEYARKVGFERTPVQGALISCIIVKSIVRAFGDSAILRVHNLEFFKPVYPGAEITVELHVLTNIKNKLVTMRSRIYIRETLHYEGMTKIRAFENI